MPFDTPSSLPDIAIGVDVGGTFTDIVVIDRKRGTLVVDKVLSTPGRLEAGIMNGLRKVLGDGALSKKLTVRAHKFSATAKRKIEEAGGSVELLEGSPEPGRESS